MSNISTLPLATVARIAKEDTGVSRIGEGATAVLASHATDYIKTLASAAGKVATHAGRSTIREDDISFVIDNGSWE